MKDFSFVTSSHPEYIENMYKDFVQNPESVDAEFRSFFQGFDFAVNNAVSNGTSLAGSTVNGALSDADIKKELAVYALIRAYRKRGHLLSKTNPIRERKDREAKLNLSDFGLGEDDLGKVFYAARYLGMGKATLKQVVERLQKTYTADVGIQYTYINDEDRCEWVKRAFEDVMNEELSLDQKKHILYKLNQGVIFEKFLHTKYVGQKRFSLEGGESTIPALDTIINASADAGVKEVVIGMAHRGRLNVLANTLGKTYEQIFTEFEGNMPIDSTMGSGDVKYHLGFRADIKTPSGKSVNVQLTPNPSHLEVVGPVVIGYARAKAECLYQSQYNEVLPIVIHGDAAIAGQGVVYEMVQMSKLRGYQVGGTIHFVINNQIGFTTDFEDARSSDYCTSIATLVQAPVIHVNGDNPELVVKMAMLAVRYRQTFGQDIFIDLVCYRKHGHNESDDPSITQPALYEIIKKHANPREIYTKQLVDRGDVDAQLAKDMEDSFWKDLQDRLDEVKQNSIPGKSQETELAWSKLKFASNEDLANNYKTAITKKQLDTLIHKITTWSADFTPLKKVGKLLEDKRKLYEESGELDWSTAELLAYASLVAEGHNVRLSGQDVQRGTFSHRHAIIHDAKTYKLYNRLDNLSDKAKFEAYNSLLSEFAVLGFEYGYTIADPNNLVIWEAQFGDFSNGAQTVIDQYISSAEAKWRKMSGLVMLLPHGYEGQGPEHSSARLERYLQLCADNNMVITNVTTAANLFHLLRRQLAWNFRKPLINFSPKANLRQVRAHSKVEAFTKGQFEPVIDDAFISDAKGVKRVVFCSGKVYFDLSDKQIREKRTDIALVRLEQLYPLPVTGINDILKKYKGAEVVWVQEESLNMGAAAYLKMNWDVPFKIIARTASAAPATGFGSVHLKELATLLEQTFTL